MELARIIATRTTQLTYDDIDAEIRDRVKYLLLDHLGVVIRGSRSESARVVHRFLESFHHPRQGQAVIGTDICAEAPFAALAHGIAAHSLELDDVVNNASLHPGVAVIPAAIAAALLSNCPATRFLEGIIAGYEITVKLGIALDPAAHYDQGFHPTATCGTFGAALAAAKIMGLSSEQTARGLGIAGSQAAGSLEFLADGSLTKRFHAGWAAHSGLLAALLAREGYTGPMSIFEGTHGFLRAYSSVSDPAKVLHGWGTPYEVMRTSIKPHACCRYKQGAIDCILELQRKNGLRPEAVQELHIAVLQAGKALVAEPEEMKRQPKSIVDAQFSMPFGAAVALVHGRAFIDQYCLENINSPVIQNLMRRVVCVDNPELEKDYPGKWPSEVVIKTKTGASYRCRLYSPKGDPENPLSWKELIEKYQSLSLPVLGKKRCDKMVAWVRNIDSQQTITGLFDILEEKG